MVANHQKLQTQTQQQMRLKHLKQRMEIAISLKQNMLKTLMTPSWKLAAQKLQSINIGVIGRKLNTSFDKILELVQEGMHNPIEAGHYLKAMKKMTVNPQNILKYAILLHIYMQQSSQIDDKKIIDFLNYLLSQCDILINVFSQVQNRQNQSNGDISAFNRTSVSTRQDEIFLCKQIFLLSCIVKSYIGLLLKLTYSFQEYRQIRKNDQIQSHQAWMVINLLKMITGISKHFTVIGRYFSKQYSYLVVLLTQTIQGDITQFISMLKKYVFTSNCMLSCSSSLNEWGEIAVTEFVTMLGEIAKLNQSLLQIYLGKYFYIYLRELPQPDWINTNSTQFDTIFKLWNSINKKGELPEKDIKQTDCSSLHTQSTNSQEKRT